MRRLWGYCAAALVAVAVAAPAAQAWTTPFNVSGAGQDAAIPQVAIDAEGNAVFTWRRFDGTNERIQARARSAAGTLSSVQSLSDAGQEAAVPQVASDKDGNAVFTWTRFDGVSDRVQTRQRSAAGTLSVVQNLSGAGQSSFQPQVAVDADGDAVFTWVRYDGTNFRVQARGRSSAGTLSGVQTLSPAGGNAFEPRVAINADGTAALTWRRYDGSDDRIQGRVRSAAGTLSAVQDLSPAGRQGIQPAVAIDPDGNAVFTWARYNGVLAPRIQTRVRSTAGTLTPVQNLSSDGFGADQPQVAVDADGDAVFTWRRFDGDNNRVQAIARSASGTLSTIQNLSAAGQFAENPQLAVEPDGDAVFVWFRFDAVNYRVQARTRSAAGALGAVADLSDAGENATAPQVATDADGDAVAAWVRPDGTNDRIQGSAGP